MNQQPDKLFRDKLRVYEQPVSPAAWERVSGSLAAKRYTKLIFRVAAAVLLLATATLLFYPAAHKPMTDTLSDTRQPSPKPRITEPPTSQKTLKETVPTPSTKDVVEKAVVAKASEKRAAPTPAIEALRATLAEPVKLVEESTSSPAMQSPRNVTIVFTRDEVNEKYLAKNFAKDATLDVENPSGLKKLLDKAYDLKHNQDLLGSLRQKKNEILAINFRNDNRTQND